MVLSMLLFQNGGMKQLNNKAVVSIAIFVSSILLVLSFVFIKSSNHIR